MLRHTFCSHLAMATQRYMHLSPAALDGAIRLLDQPLALQKFGDLVETGDREIEKSNS